MLQNVYCKVQVVNCVFAANAYTDNQTVDMLDVSTIFFLLHSPFVHFSPKHMAKIKAHIITTCIVFQIRTSNTWKQFIKVPSCTCPLIYDGIFSKIWRYGAQTHGPDYSSSVFCILTGVVSCSPALIGKYSQIQPWSVIDSHGTRVRDKVSHQLVPIFAQFLFEWATI